MINNLHLKYFSKKNMKHQLITLFIFAIVVPVLIIGSVLGVLTYRRTISHYEDLTHSQAQLVHSTIVSTSIYMYSIYETLICNPELLELLSSEDPEFDSMKATGELASLFDNTLSNTAMLTSLRLYAPDELMENVESNRYILPFTEDIKSSRWYQKSTEISGNFWISDIRTGQNDVTYWELHYCCRIPVPRKNAYAVLVMSVSNDYLRSLISSKNYQIFLNVNDEPVFISSDRHYAGRPFPLDLEKETMDSRTGSFTLFPRGQEAGKDGGGSGETETDPAGLSLPQNSSPEETVIGSYAEATLYHSSDLLHIFVADPNAMGTTRHLLEIFIGIMVLALLISAVIIFLYATYFSSRINTLRLAMYKVSNNDYEIVDTIRGDDELTETFRDMKTMVQKLKSAEARIYEAQIREQMITNQQQQMELKLLANQINPHFLYNTLEAIRMKAFVEGNRGVANAIKLLSKSMRYVLGNTQTTSTTLDKELDYIATYMAIMKLRFGTRINYDLQLDKRLDPAACQILPILLQPVIENAISHGLADLDENGHIILRIRPSQDRTQLCAYVFDNGSGMPREMLREVVSHLDTPPEDTGHGVGLYNISNRIHLFYGPEYGIAIRSKEHFGTCVTLTIPLCTTEEELL